MRFDILVSRYNSQILIVITSQSSIPLVIVQHAAKLAQDNKFMDTKFVAQLVSKGLLAQLANSQVLSFVHESGTARQPCT